MVSTEHLKDLCRTCGTTTSIESRCYIFESEGILHNILRKFNVLSVAVYESDKLPKIMCKECVNKLDLAYQFIEQIKLTEIQLQDMINLDGNALIKEESNSCTFVTSGVNALECDFMNTEIKTEIDCEDYLKNDEHLKCSSGSDKTSVDKNHIEKDQNKCSSNLETAPSSSDGINKFLSSVFYICQFCHLSSPSSTAAEEHIVQCRKDQQHIKKSTGLLNQQQESGVNADVSFALVSQGQKTCKKMSNSLNQDILFTKLATVSEEAANFPSGSSLPVQSVPFSNSEKAMNSPSGSSLPVQSVPFSNAEKAMNSPSGSSLPIQSVPFSNSEKAMNSPSGSRLPVQSVPFSNGEKAMNCPSGSSLPVQSVPFSNSEKAVNSPSGSRLPVQSVPFSNNEKAVNFPNENKSFNPVALLSNISENLSKVSVKVKAMPAANSSKFPFHACSICFIAYPNSTALAAHLENHKEFIQCRFCTKLFDSEELLADHIKQNDHPIFRRQFKIWKCSECGKESAKKHKLQDHIRTHTGDRPYPCNMCDKKFAVKSHLILHQRQHKNDWCFVCNFCGKGFFVKTNFDIHVRMAHTKEKPFKCAKCETCYSSKDALKHHILLKHTEREHHSNEVYECKICLRRYGDIQSFRYHKRTHTTTLEERRKYKCEVCETSFVKKSYLTKHIKVHTGEKIEKFECQLCGKKLASSKGLEVHLVIHSGVKNFICDCCGKAFATESTLKIHLRCHTGEKPYRCRVCSNSFTQRSSMLSHLKNIHNIDDRIRRLKKD